MDRRQRKIRQFKSEYSAYLGYDEQLEDLRQMLYELDCSMLDVKAVRTGGIRYQSASRDEQLANYATKREKLLKEIARVEANQKRISHILDMMPKQTRKNFEDVTLRRKTYYQLSDEQYRSVHTLKRDVDRAIYKAVTEEEGEHSL